MNHKPVSRTPGVLGRVDFHTIQPGYPGAPMPMGLMMPSKKNLNVNGSSIETAIIGKASPNWLTGLSHRLAFIFFNCLALMRRQSVGQFGRRRLSRDLSFTAFVQVGCDLRRRLLFPILHCKSG
jgi:hypothetical protein